MLALKSKKTNPKALMFGIENYAHLELVYLLFGVFTLIALYLWSYHWKAAKMAQFAHVKSLLKIADSISKSKKISKRILVCLAYLLLVFAMMRPQGSADHKLDDNTPDSGDKKITSSISLEDIDSAEKKGEKVVIKESARDIIFLLDVSASMGAEDLYPNRLSKAKEMIGDILGALDGEHVGLVVFTSVPSVKSILTIDYSYFRQVLDKVAINDNDFAGTKFSPALEEIINRQFDFSDNEYKDLIIITDGGDTDVEGLTGSSRTALEEQIYALSEKAFTEKGIRIHTIGLGTKAGSLVRGVKDPQGEPVKSSLNEEFLKNISQRAKGISITAADSFIDMKEIYKNRIAGGSREEIGREVEVDAEKLKELVEKQKEEGEQKVVYQELYHYPLLLALLFLTIEFFISEKRKSRLRPEES